MPQSQLYEELMVVDGMCRQLPDLSGVFRRQPGNGLLLLKKHVGPGSEHRKGLRHKLRREQAAGIGYLLPLLTQTGSLFFLRFDSQVVASPALKLRTPQRSELALRGGTLARRKGFRVREEGAPLQHRFDGLDQIASRVALVDRTTDTAPCEVVGEVLGHMQRKQDYWNIETGLRDAGGGIQAVHRGHGYVHDDYIGARFNGLRNCFTAVSCFRAYGPVCMGLQQVANAHSHHFMIVSDQDANLTRRQGGGFRGRSRHYRFASLDLE